MEKKNFRETLEWLSSKDLPMSLSKKKAAEVLCVSRNTLAKMIDNGKIKTIDNKVTLVSIASALCGG